jgi:hypothetical protein
VEFTVSGPVEGVNAGVASVRPTAINGQPLPASPGAGAGGEGERLRAALESDPEAWG